MEAIKHNSRFVTIKFTHKELNALFFAIDNNDGNGDWVDYLKDVDKKSIKDYLSVKEKILSAQQKL